jgi:hypothetical protein
VSSAAPRGRRVDCREAREAAAESDADEPLEVGARTTWLQAGHDPARPARLSSTRSDASQ